MELFPIPGNELPMDLKPVALTTGDGVRLRAAYTADFSTDKGTICICPGRSEFIEKYFETITDLQERGFAVAILDWRGQGGSDRPLPNPMKGHVRSFREYDADLETFMTQLVLPDCPPPYFVLAHSMGANIVLRSLRHKQWFERGVLSAPLLRLSRYQAPRFLLRTITNLAVLCGFGKATVPGFRKPIISPDGFAGNVLTSEERRYKRDCRTLEAAPVLRLGGPTWGWLRAALASMRLLMAMPRTGEPLMPVLMIAAGNDKVVSSTAPVRLAKKTHNLTAVVIDKAMHEALQERNEIRDQFWAAFDSFMDS